MFKHRLGLVGAVMIAAFCLTAVAMAQPRGHASSKAAGTVVIGSEAPSFSCFNIWLNDCNYTWAGYMMELMQRGPYVIQPNYAYKPDLISSARLQLNPMRVTYNIRKNAVWSDGKPVTAQDFIFTVRTIMNKAWDSKPQGSGIVGRNGYELMTNFKLHGPKSVTITFKKPYADWKDLFALPGVLPQHVLAGKDFTTQWYATGPTVSDGPYRFVSYTPNQQIVLTANPRFYGHQAQVKTLVWRIMTDANTQIQALRGGEVDAIYPLAQPSFGQLRGQSGITVQSNLGPQYEHIDIQFGPNGAPILRNPWARRALMMSINRTQLVKAIFGQLNPGVKPLDNVIYMSNQPEFQAHFNRWNFNLAGAAKLWQQHGCTKGGDGFWVCNGQKLSFKLTANTTALRQEEYAILQQQLKQAGIDLQNDLNAKALAGQIQAGQYQLGMFGWSGSPDPAPSRNIWACGQTQNWMGYCNRAATTLMEKGDAELNPDKRVALENGADQLMANDVPTIPLYQKPTFFAFSTKLHGAVDNTTQEGPTWNAEFWSLG
jgi:peptide/nickel transport system substrate-binding protein